jgi:VCBS repeat-containing protein
LAIRTSDNTTVDGTFVGATSIPDSVAVRPDGKRVYVTQRGGAFNQVFFIDNTAAPATIGTFALTASRPGPVGITIAPHSGGKFYAYIAKQNPGSGNIGAVDVFDVTTDLPTSVASLDTGANTQPVSVAFDSSDSTAAQVYVTLNGSNQFAVIDNTASPPTIGTAQNLPDPTLAATDTPVGIAFPPHGSGATAQAYIAISNKNQIDIIDNSAPPVIATGSPVIVTTATARLAGIAAIPLPK